MNIEKVEKEKAENSKLKQLIVELQSESEIKGLDFEKNMHHRMQSKKIRPGTKTFLQEVMA